MRYEADRKQATRMKMVETAARVLRRDGIAAAGVAGLMAEAGLTNGAFYAHFDSKEALVAEAVVSALAHTRAAMATKIEQAPAGQALEAVIFHYLDPQHVAHPEHGCAIAALGPELARRPESTRLAIDDAIERIVATIADAIPGVSGDPVAAARAVFASMVGTIQLARTAHPARIPAILQAGAVAARTLGQSIGHSVPCSGGASGE
ncbi:TetR/AcrR family transcriptional regulator [Massilia sp. METH4]|uniref:TetR/AcrR family transcriptional regulator n=1 Tax=Massilia sp. METH4 TaxID=3123041 RepID=UPI0030CFC1C4